jgi:hypothetical protein
MDRKEISVKMSTSKGFIRYIMRNGVESGIYCLAKRIDGKKVNNDVFLGKVINKNKGIFYKKKVFYKFTIDNGIINLPIEEQEYYKNSNINESSNYNKKEYYPTLILDFGDVYIINKVLQNNGLIDIFSKAYPNDVDTLITLILYKLIDGNSNKYASIWQNMSYIKCIYPKAKVTSQRITEFLALLGEEFNYRTFYYSYHNYLRKITAKFNVLIDSTGLPNDINFPLKALNNHNGVISNEARLILVVDKNSNYPIYFKYIPGNIIDVSTLQNIFIEVSAYKIQIDQVIMDAGYFCEENIKLLFNSNFPFVIRLSSNRSIFKDLIKTYAKNIHNTKYIVKYRDRILFVRCVKVDIYGNKGYAYICLDLQRKFDEEKKYICKLDPKKTDISTINEDMLSHGIFILITSKMYLAKDIIPIYYTRQAIEQVFDYAKNEAEILPLRVHNEKTFRGHLFLSFLTTIAYISINNELKDTKYCTKGIILGAKGLKCAVYNDFIVPSIPNKVVNEITRIFKIEVPKKLSMW